MNEEEIKADTEAKSDNEVITISTGSVTSTKEIGLLADALAKSQGEFETVVKDSDNPYFKSKYADLAMVISATRKALSKHGIAVMQFTSGDNTLVTVTTRLVHKSGQWIESSVSSKPVKTDIQAQGSVTTYLRRYSLSAIISVAQDDLDGNDVVYISNTQIVTLITKLEGHEDIKSNLLKGYKAFEKIPADQYDDVILKIEKHIADKKK